MMNFKALNLLPELQHAISDLDFYEMTPIQEMVIPKILNNESVIGQSKTGTGKSHSFLIPLINHIDASEPVTQVIITSPSRELATQLFAMAKDLLKYLPDIKATLAIGGTDKAKQINHLMKTQPHLVIGTPGRIYDLMKENALLTQSVSYFVVDEADMTLDMGFLKLVDDIATRLSTDLKMYAFSATLPQQLMVFLNRYMAHPDIIKVNTENLISDTVTSYLINVRSQNETALLYDLLTLGNPYLVLIFANTKQRVDDVHKALTERGLTVAKIHGDIPARERRRTMNRVKQLEFQYVVATDLAARGIDIPGVSEVINLDVPRELEFFIHRVGRTGRQGVEGTAITFYHPDLELAISALEKRGISFEEVTLRNGQLVSVDTRHKRERRKRATTDEIGTQTRGFIKKKKKTIKPGYKRKIKEQIKKEKRQNRPSK